MNRMFLTVGFVWMIATTASTQQSPSPGEEKTASFDVVSIKPNTDRISNAIPSSQSNGSYSASNVAVKPLIASAYQLRMFQIEGGPDWLASERFDIVARGRDGTPDRLRSAMLRTLLAERFKLVAHFEQREQPVYVLTLLRDDGRPGPQLKPSAPASGSSAGFPSASVDKDTARLNGRRVSMDTLATMLTDFVFNQRVIDRTGLDGEFELDLRFTPNSSSAAAPEFPSIFTAVREQLGLKLEPSRGPVDVLVIDSVERPAPN